ncbi:MAG: hypothetical protein A2365_00085 [Candidatus Nealsonbacteria bacterium RIFOXYB1_FULL_40_15]|uniref:Uncharacterized protein n=2 Tax=Candidatus Nealsoniibacteriota TaxID=1817911 RepID=A0A1G2EUF7_9BACT|nr:MAG: hypothetical protein A2365_00085 [Candidatus Nealsonbacteria bacterium RIFOXYB1_FULL_40_15]OGZ29152.1 MAG: hypothetical protein A2427_03650 [Candidatus Nealsonbacteria bacterium RIFOXYC1_FULL_40_7]
MSDRTERHICPHCGQRNRDYRDPVCNAGKQEYDRLVEAAAEALITGSEIPQIWGNIFAWAYYWGQEKTFPRLEKELKELQDVAAKRKEEIRSQAVADVANRLRSLEGKISTEVRERAVAKITCAAEFSEESIKKAHGQRLGLENLRQHLQWLKSRIDSDQKRKIA